MGLKVAQWLFDCKVGPMHGFDHGKWRGDMGAGESWSAYRTEVGVRLGKELLDQ